MASNPYAQFAKPNPYAVYSTPATGPKPSSGFAVQGSTIRPQTFIPGSENDPAVIARRTSATAGAEQAARIAAERQIIGMHDSTPMAQAELAKAQADAIVARQKADEAKAEQAIGTMAPNSDVHGDAYLNQFVPPAMRNVVKAYARGDLGSRSGGMSTSMLPIIQHAMNYDPSASGTNFPARVKMQSDLASGDPKSAGGSLQAFERMLLHGSEVLDAGGKLNNFRSGVPALLNYPKAAAESVLQDPDLAHFNAMVRNYAPEAQKAVSGVSGGEAERQDRASSFSGSMSPQALVGGLQADAKQAYDAMQATNDRYKRIMGHDIVDALSPAARQAYNKIMAGGYDPKTGKALLPADGFTPIGGAGGTGGPPDYRGDGKGINNTEVDNAPPASYEEFRSALEQKINSGQITTVADAQKFAAATPGFALGDPKIIQANIDQVKRGLKANVASPVTTAPQPMTGPQAGLTNAADALSFGTLPKIGAGLSAVTSRLTGSPLGVGELYARQLDANRSTMDQGFQDHPFWSAAGTAAGIGTGEGLISRIPAVARGLDFLPQAARMPASDALYSGTMSAGGSDWDNPGNVGVKALMGTLAGGAGSAAGGATARGAGMMFRGVTNPAVRYLRDAGVPMTVGQVAGGPLKAVEDRLSSIFPQINNRRTEGLQGFNRAGFDQGLAPINGLDVNGTGPVPATTNGVIGAQGVDLARNARSTAYGNTLDPASFTRDAQFGTDEAAARGAAGQLPDDMANRATYALDRAGQNFSPADELSGRGFQQSLRRFRRATSQNASLPNGDDLGDVMGQAEDAYTGLVGRQAPDILPAYQAANTANRNVSILQDAVNRARNGTRSGETDLFTPSQLSDAAAANSRHFGGTQGTTNQPFFDLTRAGQQVLPSSVPDSGTAGRMALMALPGALGGTGAGAGYAAGDTKKGAATGLSLAAILAMGGTRTGQRFLTSALLDRPQLLQTIGDRVIQARPYAGMFGAGLGAGVVQ